jgi:hypothetical protein
MEKMTQRRIWPARRKTAADESNNSITEKYPKIYKPNRGVMLDKIHQESANELETNRGYIENLKSDSITSQRHNKMEMTLTMKNLKFLLYKNQIRFNYNHGGHRPPLPHLIGTRKTRIWLTSTLENRK